MAWKRSAVKSPKLHQIQAVTLLRRPVPVHVVAAWEWPDVSAAIRAQSVGERTGCVAEVEEVTERGRPVLKCRLDAHLSLGGEVVGPAVRGFAEVDGVFGAEEAYLQPIPRIASSTSAPNGSWPRGAGRTSRTTPTPSHLWLKKSSPEPSQIRSTEEVGADASCSPSAHLRYVDGRGSSGR
jgi:hypothetical protein